MAYQSYQFNTNLATSVYLTLYNAFPSQSSPQLHSIEQAYQLCQSDTLLSFWQPTTVTSAYLTHYKAFPLQSSMQPCSIEQAYQPTNQLDSSLWPWSTNIDTDHILWPHTKPIWELCQLPVLPLHSITILTIGHWNWHFT